jgi:hypothetical protein
MTTLFLRELLVLSQRRAFAIAAATFVLLTIGFTLTWPTGVPLYAGAALFPQLALVQQLLLTAMTPWIVCRCGTRERGNALVHLSLFASARPSHIMMARFAAGVVALLTILVGVLPALVYAQHVDAEGARTLGLVVIETIAVMASAVAWTLACEQALRNYVGAWLVATSVSLALVAATQLVAPWSIIPVMTIVLSVGCLLLVGRRADVHTRYLSEEGA